MYYEIVSDLFLDEDGMLLLIITFIYKQKLSLVLAGKSSANQAPPFFIGKSVCLTSYAILKA